jgi:hypothetical protein
MTEPMTDDEMEQCEQVARELKALPQPCIVELSAFDAYVLVGLLQWSLKNPEVPLYCAAFASGMVDSLRMIFEATGCETVVQQIDAQSKK